MFEKRFAGKRYRSAKRPKNKTFDLFAGHVTSLCNAKKAETILGKIPKICYLMSRDISGSISEKDFATLVSNVTEGKRKQF